jgi:hypothetical protein
VHEAVELAELVGGDAKQGFFEGVEALDFAGAIKGGRCVLLQKFEAFADGGEAGGGA